MEFLVKNIIKNKTNFVKFYNEVENKPKVIETNGCHSILKRIKNLDGLFIDIELLDENFVQSIFNDIPNTDKGDLILACRNNGCSIEAYFVGRTFKELRDENDDEYYKKEYISQPNFKQVDCEVKLVFKD